jgi:hypothetical protein
MHYLHLHLQDRSSPYRLTDALNIISVSVFVMFKFNPTTGATIRSPFRVADVIRVPSRGMLKRGFSIKALVIGD